MPNQRRRWPDSVRPSVAEDRAGPPAEVTDDAIRVRAYELYEARGGEPGADVDENCVSPPMEPTTKRLELPTKRTRRTAYVTSTPDTPPPQLLCPTCDRPLAYRQTVLGGVKPVERWDYFACRTCGEFVYRDRTRQLRRA
jgi:DUF2934 family protein